MFLVGEVLMYYLIVYIIGRGYVWGIANTLSIMLNYLDVDNLVANCVQLGCDLFGYIKLRLNAF